MCLNLLKRHLLVNNKEAVLNKDVVPEYNLPSPLVCVAHIEALAKYQEDMEFKCAPELTVKDLYPSHFGKMNTNEACHVFSHHGAGALDFLADQNVFDPKVKTTAWFMDLMNKWFKILSSKSLVNALSLKNMTAYEAAISVMRLVIEVFKTTKGYDYVRMGMFTNDIVENSFSGGRKQRPLPNFSEAK
ncbi:hypothetical protein FOCC_FOCC011668 [Frankliniella occidentalis]|nr:hypothetical protein FOCC_FOCC011668 [Frankliniella occidentalis]